MWIALGKWGMLDTAVTDFCGIRWKETKSRSEAVPRERKEGYIPCQKHVEFWPLFTTASVVVRERMALSFARSSLLHPHTLLPFVTLEFCLKFCQCQCEAGKETVFVGVWVACGFLLLLFLLFLFLLLRLLCFCSLRIFKLDGILLLMILLSEGILIFSALNKCCFPFCLKLFTELRSGYNSEESTDAKKSSRLLLWHTIIYCTWAKPFFLFT